MEVERVQIDADDVDALYETGTNGKGIRRGGRGKRRRRKEPYYLIARVEYAVGVGRVEVEKNVFFFFFVLMRRAHFGVPRVHILLPLESFAL